MWNKVFQQLLGLAALSVGILTNANLAQSQPIVMTIDKLANGNYQFCSRPKPNDWRDGAGVCLNFAKVGDQVDGYYGYPHSDVFVCIRGNIRENRIVGRGLAIAGLDSQPSGVPPNHFEDAEKRLILDRAKLIRSIRNRRDRTDWTLFQAASLNLRGFYQYAKPQMTPTAQLCDWSIVNASR